MNKQDSPLDFFNLDHWNFGDSKSVNFLEAYLETGDCIYIPAYYYYQSKTNGDENYANGKVGKG